MSAELALPRPPIDVGLGVLGSDMDVAAALSTLSTINASLAQSSSPSSASSSSSTPPSPLVLLLYIVDQPPQAQASPPVSSLMSRLSIFDLAPALSPAQHAVLGWSLALVGTTLVLLALKSVWSAAVDRGVYAVLGRHDEWEGMLVSGPWPAEGKAFRAPTLDGTLSKLLARLDTIGAGNATIIHALDVIVSALAQLPRTPHRVAQVTDDLAHVDAYVARLPHLMAAVEHTLAHLVPQPGAFAGGMKSITAKYEAVLADDTTTLRERLDARWALFVLGSYTLEEATKYMATKTAAARASLAQREEEIKVIGEMLPSALLRLQRVEPLPEAQSDEDESVPDAPF